VVKIVAAASAVLNERRETGMRADAALKLGQSYFGVVGVDAIVFNEAIEAEGAIVFEHFLERVRAAATHHRLLKDPMWGHHTICPKSYGNRGLAMS